MDEDTDIDIDESEAEPEEPDELIYIPPPLVFTDEVPE